MSVDPTGPGLRLRSLLLLAAVLVSGALAGIALDRLAFGSKPERVGIYRPATENGIPVRLKGLGLTQEQEDRIRAVAARWQPRADSVMNQLLPRVREIDHGMFQEMLCVLTPAQDSAYLAWRKRKGLNQAEGEEQMTRVREGSCPR